MTSVGARVRSLHWDEVTSGRERYAADNPPPGTLVGKILRSPWPFAIVERIAVDRARGLPGVRAVITASDFAPGMRYLHHGGPLADRPPLADGLVRFVGQEVAAVAAESVEAVEGAIAAIEVDYRPIRHAPLDIDAARRATAARLHDRPTGEANVAVHDAGFWGDVTGGRAAGTITAEGTFWYPRVNHACMEPNTTLAWWHPDTEQLELWTSTQAPWFITTEVAHVLGLRAEQVVCRDVAVGGGFGSKSKVSEHEAIAAALSRASGAPVLVAFSRDEEFAATKPRHAFRTHLRIHADDAGRLRMFDAGIDVDNGAYNHYGPSVMKVGIKTLGSIYGPDGVEWDARLIDTALPPGGQFRGYGSPQVALALESLIDELAERQGIDPIEYRIRNANPPGSTTLCGARLGSARLVECLEAVRDAIDWADKRANRRAYRGVGVAAGMHGSGSYAFPDANRSEATIDVLADGRVRVRFGGADAGTGQRTILAQVAADELGVTAADVDVLMGDSELAPFDMGAWSSRGTHMGGHAVRKAASELGARLRQLAAEKLGEIPDAIQLRAGRAEAPGSGGSASEAIELGDLVGASADAVDGCLSHTAAYVDDRMELFGADNPTPNVAASYTFAAHAVEVEVDPGTGQVRVLDYVAAHDVGRAINPTMVEGQIIGGVVQGLGAALGEELIYEGGRAVNPAYVDYALPRAADLPRIRPILVEGPEPAGPHGAKSVGEMPIVPPAPALVNAIYDAIGIRFRELPITPDKVLAALQATGDRPGSARSHRLWRRPDRWQIAAARWLYPRGLHTVLHRWGTRLARQPGSGPIQSIGAPTDRDDLVRQLAAATGRRAGRGTAAVIGGGTDLLAQRRQGLATPVRLLSVAEVDELKKIERRPDGSVSIGAAVTLARIERELEGDVPVLAETVRTIASAQIRAQATLAGNLAQAKRCWFFRNGFDCYKRGGVTCPCYAVLGDHRFHHAALGAHRCQAVTPSDLATTLVALDAEVAVASTAGERIVPAARLYRGPGETALRPGELIAAVVVDRSARARRAVFEKLALWSGDFALVAIAASAELDVAGRARDVRLVVGGLAPTPWRARAAEAALERRASVEAAVGALTQELDRTAHPLPGNAWKLDATVGLARRALIRLVQGPDA